MNHTTVLVLFSIPLVCIAIIGLNQIKDEMFKKKFEIERRKREAASGQKTEHNRRYNDRQAPGDQSNPTREPLGTTKASN